MNKPSPEILAALNERIAVMMGWQLKTVDKTHCFSPWIDPQGHRDCYPPMYVGSLDAIHEAEKLIHDNPNGEKWNYFAAMLRRLCAGRGIAPEHAPAHLRAIALDRTLSPEPIL